MDAKKVIASILILLFLWSDLAFAAVRGREVMYVGGTIAEIPEGTKGLLDTKDKKVLTFESPQGSFEIPYDQITSLEYGQKAGRRLGVAITLTIWALFSKKRKHFLTIGFKDGEGDPQGVVLEIPKQYTKVFIATIEARSGIECEYESEEARKHVHG
ncbi:MAG: hypothetical protein L0338_27845 [Acidobacteria bacterium]|nr:hypothetical protein [Acidobacteriota bacterium]